MFRSKFIGRIVDDLRRPTTLILVGLCFILSIGKLDPRSEFHFGTFIESKGSVVGHTESVTFEHPSLNDTVVGIDHLKIVPPSEESPQVVPESGEPVDTEFESLVDDLYNVQKSRESFNSSKIV